MRTVPNLAWGDCIAYLARRWEEEKKARRGR